tara:strand:+ start:5511 stop:5936 length:426 start_codon:yes stop_codon:yes gene_type:complete
MKNKIDLTVIIPTLNEKDNLIHLIPNIRGAISVLTNCYEILVIDGGSKDGTIDAANSLGAKTAIQRLKGYGDALKEGFEYAKGKYILTLDADLSHNPEFIIFIWEKRHETKIITGEKGMPQKMFEIANQAYRCFCFRARIA